MDILFLLIPLSVVLAFLIGWCFWRAVDTGQFDDLDTPAVRILADDDAPAEALGLARAAHADPPSPATSPPGLTQIKSPAARVFIIESIVIESRDRDYVEQRVRAGVLEQGTVDLLIESGVGERLQREGLTHHGIELRFGGGGHRIDLTALTGGRSIVVYGQQEVVKDLIRARIKADGKIRLLP